MNRNEARVSAQSKFSPSSSKPLASSPRSLASALKRLFSDSFSSPSVSSLSLAFPFESVFEIQVTFRRASEQHEVEGEALPSNKATLPTSCVVWLE